MALNLIMKYLTILFLFLILSCESKIVRKELHNQEVIARWCFSSEITNSSPDVVELEFKDSIVTIIKADGIIYDIELNDEALIITHLDFKSGNDVSLVTGEFFGKKVVYNEVSYEEVYRKHQENEN